MNLSLVLSLVNVVLALISTFSVFRLVGNWREVVQTEETTLRATNFGKLACCLRVRLSFSKACRRVDDYCGMIGTGAVALVAVAVIFALVVVIVENIAPASTSATAAAGQPSAGTTPLTSASAPGTAQPTRVQSGQTGSPAKGSTPASDSKYSLYLYGVNSVLLVLLAAILAGVAHLKVIGSVLQAAREFQW